jgi:hypothetical protein
MKTIKFVVLSIKKEFDVPFMLVENVRNLSGKVYLHAPKLFTNSQVVDLYGKTAAEVQKQINDWKDDGSPVLFYQNSVYVTEGGTKGQTQSMVHPVGNEILVGVFANSTFSFTLPKEFSLIGDVRFMDQAYLTRRDNYPVSMFANGYTVENGVVTIKIEPTEYFEFKATGKGFGLDGNKNFNNGRRHVAYFSLVCNKAGFYTIGENIAGNSFLIQ